MDKIILVHYLTQKNLRREQYTQLYNEYNEKVIIRDKDILNFILPTEDEFRIECINPKLISEAEYIDVKKFLEEAQEKLDKFFDEK